jgi:hypothetical protein
LAKRFHGQTIWQSSQPNTRLPISRAQLDGMAAQLDGQVRDAACIQHIGPDKRLGRADVQAGLAAPAVLAGGGFVHRQRQVDEQFGEEEVATGLAVEQQRVLADPAQPGLFGQGFSSTGALSTKAR